MSFESSLYLDAKEDYLKVMPKESIKGMYTNSSPSFHKGERYYYVIIPKNKYFGEELVFDIGNCNSVFYAKFKALVSLMKKLNIK